MTAVGIYNPNSHYNRNERTEALNSLLKAAARSSSMFTIASYADKIAGRYEAILYVVRGGGSPAVKAERLATEYETQLTMLAEFADEEAGL